ncbi:hypothetical protein EVG20_g6229 [Dentipellis fragilis]|uniref:Uncharacterized protein n=1 Tax=Dentipellis fragilis TaxID=205917 RepID=A0A4Y9YPK4_9AGAM|nr:hypothetical protein EVG20_g6229 [Dentipellis fragilis]
MPHQQPQHSPAPLQQSPQQSQQQSSQLQLQQQLQAQHMQGGVGGPPAGQQMQPGQLLPAQQQAPIQQRLPNGQLRRPTTEDIQEGAEFVARFREHWIKERNLDSVSTHVIPEIQRPRLPVMYAILVREKREEMIKKLVIISVIARYQHMQSSMTNPRFIIDLNSISTMYTQSHYAHTGFTRAMAELAGMERNPSDMLAFGVGINRALRMWDLMQGKYGLAHMRGQEESSYAGELMARSSASSTRSRSYRNCVPSIRPPVDDRDSVVGLQANVFRHNVASAPQRDTLKSGRHDFLLSARCMTARNTASSHHRQVYGVNTNPEVLVSSLSDRDEEESSIAIRPGPLVAYQEGEDERPWPDEHSSSDSTGPSSHQSSPLSSTLDLGAATAQSLPNPSSNAPPVARCFLFSLSRHNHTQSSSPTRAHASSPMSLFTIRQELEHFEDHCAFRGVTSHRDLCNVFALTLSYVVVDEAFMRRITTAPAFIRGEWDELKHFIINRFVDEDEHMRSASPISSSSFHTNSSTDDDRDNSPPHRYCYPPPPLHSLPYTQRAPPLVTTTYTVRDLLGFAHWNAVTRCPRTPNEWSVYLHDFQTLILHVRPAAGEALSEPRVRGIFWLGIYEPLRRRIEQVLERRTGGGFPWAIAEVWEVGRSLLESDRRQEENLQWARGALGLFT